MSSPSCLGKKICGKVQPEVRLLGTDCGVVLILLPVLMVVCENAKENWDIGAPKESYQGVWMISMRSDVWSTYPPFAAWEV